MEKMDLVYIGPKPFKRDTLTGSRLIFPHGKPVAVPTDMAHRLLQHPGVWIEAAQRDTWQAEHIRLVEEARVSEATQQQQDELARQRREMVCGEYGDLGKLTAAQLRTLVEGAELEVEPQGAQEKVDAFRLRVRDALRVKMAAQA